MRNGPYELVVAPPEYPGKRYRGRYCYEHHLVYWRKHGVLPSKRQVVHHKNHDTRDNRVSNLELKSKGRHSADHTNERGAQLVLLRCPGCDTVFEKPRRNTHLVKGGSYSCCGRPCIGRATALARLDPSAFTRRIARNVIKEFHSGVAQLVDSG